MDSTEADLRRVAGVKDCAARKVLSDYLTEQGRAEDMPPLLPMFLGDCATYDQFRSIFEDYHYGSDDKTPQRHWDAGGFPVAEELLYVNQQEDSYEGSIRFVWRKGAQLFEERMSHCSCNSYSEDADFRPKALDGNKVTVAALRLRKMDAYDRLETNFSDRQWQAFCDALDVVMGQP